MEVDIFGMFQLAKRKVSKEIQPNSSFSEAEITQLMEDELNYDNDGDYFDEDSRAYIFQSLFYEPNRLVIIERVVVFHFLLRFIPHLTLQVFEFTASGVVEITEKKGYYRPHIKDSEENSHFRLDIGLLIMTILAYILNIGAHVNQKSLKHHQISDR